MRTYQPIWEKLKVEYKANVAVEPKLHTKIVRAVIKEKNEDTAWKYVQAEQNKKWKLQYKIEGKLITFFLKDISHLLPVSIHSL